MRMRGRSSTVTIVSDAGACALGILLLLSMAVAAACGGEPNDETASAVEASAPVATTVPADAEKGASATTVRRSAPLSPLERRRVTTIASRLDRAIDRFDRSVSSCTGANRGACIDRAWAVIVTDAEWPLYYLVRMRPRARSCDALAEAMAELDGFNLAGRQVDYGPPGETGESKSSARLALVDTLRPLPEELRSAAAARCG